MHVKIAINTNFKGKFKNRRDNWRLFNDTFSNRELHPLQLIRHIKQGHSYTTQHRGRRRRENFVCGQHLATDHDTGDEKSSFQYLLKNPFIQKYAYALHTTPSHTEDTPRCRVLYILDREVHNRDSYELMTSALCYQFDEADQSVKDACRFFFGNPGATVKILGNILPVEAVATELIVPYKNRPVETKTFFSPNGSQPPNTLIRRIFNDELNKIASVPDGHKYWTLLKVSRTLGGYVGAGYLPESLVRQSLINAISKRDIKSLNAAIKGIDNSMRYGMQQPLTIYSPTQEEVSGLEQCLSTLPN